jgi:hypothetical protein
LAARTFPGSDAPAAAVSLVAWLIEQPMSAVYSNNPKQHDATLGA